MLSVRSAPPKPPALWGCAVQVGNQSALEWYDWITLPDDQYERFRRDPRSDERLSLIHI